MYVNRLLKLRALSRLHLLFTLETFFFRTPPISCITIICIAFIPNIISVTTAPSALPTTQTTELLASSSTTLTKKLSTSIAKGFQLSKRYSINRNVPHTQGQCLIYQHNQPLCQTQYIIGMKDNPHFFFCS